ncbi:MAG: hypothetical protein A4E39_01709 [Methanoregulaceae archaeon PtaB.Bin152]|nr:MAG: hypothetical protein A4E39_01709 [Methanoregulaceae archaeon PtaB.Bin152]
MVCQLAYFRGRKDDGMAAQKKIPAEFFLNFMPGHLRVTCDIPIRLFRMIPNNTSIRHKRDLFNQ